MNEFLTITDKPYAYCVVIECNQDIPYSGDSLYIFNKKINSEHRLLSEKAFG